MSGDVLQRIQTLQFTDKRHAEMLLADFVTTTFSLELDHIELRPLAVSLNSFNGFMTLKDGRRLFFKTHTEPDSIIGEYYHAALLAEAGYPVIRTVYSSTEAEKQFLIYDLIDDPSVFDVAWDIENGNETHFSGLAQAQHSADDQLMAVYRRTLAQHSPEDAARAPIHQLFHHRLAEGRLARFYGPLPGQPGAEVDVRLPGGTYPMSQVRRCYWEINGQRYEQTLDDLILDALRLLNPPQAGPAVVGHGDAHNGNVFYRTAAQQLVYFDPAFAGRHHPLLDLIKPLFHNVFAMWMYFPLPKRDQTRITMQRGGAIWRIEHDYQLHPVREMFLQSKVERVLMPILAELKQRDWLRPDWRRYLKAGLFCCPLLTMNLAEAGRFPPEISLLGLTMAVEMGANSIGQRSRIDHTLDEVTAAVG